MKKEIEQLVQEIGNNLELIYEHPFEDVKGVYGKILTKLTAIADDNTERYSSGNRKEAQEQGQLEQRLEENGSEPMN